MRVNIISDTIQEFNGERFYLCGNYFQHDGKRLHRTVYEYFYGDIPKGYDVHHIDENRANNNIENLRLLPSKEHQHIHMAEPKRILQSQNAVKIASEYAKAWHKSKEGRTWHSEHMKEMLRNRKVKEYQCDFCGKTFKTQYTYPKGSRKFCCENCKMKARRRRLNPERYANEG